MPTRRVILAGAAGLAACAAPRPAPDAGPTPTQRIAEIEAEVGGAVGLFALDTGSGASIGHRQHERFAMCSTFKWALAAAVLDLSARGGPTLDDEMLFNARDLLDYAPFSRERLGQAEIGRMTVQEACAASVSLSDNTAANLLLNIVGGPPGLTRFFYQHGDPYTRLDRTEPTLNENAPGDERDTTLPSAMVGAMQRLLLGDALPQPLRELLIGWMVDSKTGAARLRAGLPAHWRVGDKTGTGVRGAVNDVAIAWPPQRAPILIACYMSGGEASTETLSAAHARIAGVVAEAFA